MDAHQAQQLRDAWNRQVAGVFEHPDSPVAFYHNERFGPKLKSDQSWRLAYQASSAAPVYNQPTTVEADHAGT